MPSLPPLLRWLVEPEAPGLGLDLRAGSLSLARIADKRGGPELDLCITSPLPEGCLRFDVSEPNVLDAELLKQTLRSVLERSGAADQTRIALTLPDYLARISVIELADAPRTTAETLEMLRFRLGKSIPFDAEAARIAFEPVPGAKSTFVTGVMHEAVVSQYEDLLGELGLHVGLVLPGSLSLLQIAESVARKYLAPGSDFFLVNVESDYFTVSLVRDRDKPALVRTLGRRAQEDATTSVFDESDLIQEIIPTAMYYREKLKGTTLQRVYYRSVRGDLARIHELLEEQFEAPSEPLSLTSAIPKAASLQLDDALANVVGPAAGAAVGKVA